MTKFDVVTFGSAVIDIFVDTNFPEKGKFMSYPVGSKILIEDVKFDIGGGGTNTAVAFSRLGLKTGYIGKIGLDTNTEAILETLRREKIKFLGVVKKRASNGYSIILDSKENNRTILTYKGPNNELSIKELKLRKIKTKWIYYSSLLGESFKTQIELARYLKEKKQVKLAFNPSEYLIKRKPSEIKDLLRISEVLILNKEEARLLTKDKNLLKGLYRLGPKIVVITDKNNPMQCYDSYSGKVYTLKPHKIKVIERTGAGDAFASGFVAGLIAKKTILECLKLGLRESESVIQHFGAKNNLLRMKLR